MTRTGTLRAAGAVAFVAFLCLPACHRTVAPSLERPVEIPVKEAQKKLAVDALNQLREMFNQGSCQGIYDQAAPDFQDQTLEEWMSQCEDLRGSLGAWQIFNSASASASKYAPSSDFVFLEGAAVFAKGSKQLGVGWRLDQGHARLVQIGLQETEFRWRLLPPRQARQRLQDPPPRNFRMNFSSRPA